MRKNQTLGLLAVAFIAAGFGAKYYLQSNDDVQAGIAPVHTKSLEERRAKQMAIANMEPAAPSRVEKALKERWSHLDEDILTTAAVESDGTLVFFDKELVVGLDGDGNTIYAQGAHRSYKMKGPVLKTFSREPMKATKRGAVPGNSYFIKALTEGDQFKPENRPASTKTPAGQ